MPRAKKLSSRRDVRVTPQGTVRFVVQGYPASVHREPDGWWIGRVQGAGMSGVVSQERTSTKAMASLRAAVKNAIAVYTKTGWPRSR